MDALLKHPLLQPAHVDMVVASVIPDESEFALTNDVPIVNSEYEEIIIDERDAVGGMTHAVARGAESPTVEVGGRAQVAFRPAFFREKIMLSEDDMRPLRRLGSESDLETAEEKINSRLAALRMRLETRIEWAKWQMVMGRLTINQPDTMIDIDYKVPAEFRPVLAPAQQWDQATSDPIQDMQDWIFQYRDEGIEPDFFQFNSNIERVLFQNDKIRTIHESLIVGSNNASIVMSRQALSNILVSMIGLPYKVYDKGYMLKMRMQTEMTAGVTTTVIVNENQGLQVGDEVTLIHSQGQRVARERLTITAIVGRQLTFAAAPVNSYPAGSQVVIKRRFIPDNKFVIRGRIPPSVEGGPNFGKFVSVPSVYAPGGMMNPRPGVFAKVLPTDGDPPKIELITGIYGLPVPLFPTANLVAQVLA